MNKHTPGPWAADISGDIYEVATSYGIGEAWRADPQGLVNARLMAASPELLSALERLTARAEQDICDPIDVPEIQYAKQIIAKATGAQP